MFSITVINNKYFLQMDDYVPSGPLPVVPVEECSSEDELEDEETERTESPVSEKSDSTCPTSP